MASMVREAWTDDRLDDLNTKVDRLDQRMEAGFAETRQEFRSVRSEMAQQFAAQNRMIVQLFATMLIGFLSVIATVLSQT
ncbi:MAG TPA: hypothetical protein VGI73_00400 [Solirubrobacterales bacterium]|jgi:hypothetical protein